MGLDMKCICCNKRDISFYENENNEKGENIVCPVCKSKNVILRSKNMVNSYAVYICSNCTLKFVNPFSCCLGGAQLTQTYYKMRGFRSGTKYE